VRQMAFQGAYSAVVGDEGSVFVNPAGMAPVRRGVLGISYERGLFGTTLSSAAGVLRVGRFDLGLGLVYLDYGGDSVIVPDPVFGGDRGIATGDMITAYNALAVGAVAYRRGMLSIGASVKYLREQIGGDPTVQDYSSNALTGDVGLAIAVFDIMAIGFTMQNIAGHLIASDGTPYDLPSTWRLGYTLNFVDPLGTARLLSTVDWVHPPGGNSWAAFGFEGGIVTGDVGLVARAGISVGRPDSDRTDYSFGAGLVVRGVHVDYAWQPYDQLGDAHRFGVRWIP